MTAEPWLRKLLLTVHVTTSVGWIGAIIAYIVLNVVALTSREQELVRAAYLMLDPLLRFAIVPLALGCLATGVLQSLVTQWGLFRHYWVVLSLWLTIIAVGVLLLHVPAVVSLSARAADPGVDPNRFGGDLPHTLGGLLLVCVPLVLNIYKPRGLTRRGRRLRDRTAAAGRRTDALRTRLNTAP